MSRLGYCLRDGLRETSGIPAQPRSGGQSCHREQVPEAEYLAWATGQTSLSSEAVTPYSLLPM